VGAEPALRALDEAIEQALSNAGWPVGPDSNAIDAACFGLAGSDRAEDKAVLESWNRRTSRIARLVLVNDGDLVLAAGTPEGLGVAVIAGTGSIAVGRGPDGRSARAGGWGYLLGDEGSAYAVALAALRLSVRRFDGRDALRVLKTDRPKPDALTGYLCRALGAASPAEFVPVIYDAQSSRSRIAELAPVVLAAAKDDPDVLGWILEPAGYELGQAVRAVVRALDWQGPNLPLAMAGSFLLSAEPVREAMLAYIKRFGPCTVVPRTVSHPVEGALILARKELGR
jgi:N-acetylglucosamine kinase-like BadF-type ATPase